MRLWLLIIGILGTASCGGPAAIVEKKCDATGPCFTFTSKGHAEIEIKSPVPNRDYYIWILSDKTVTQKNQSKRSIRVTSNRASSRLSVEEEKIRSELKSKNGLSPSQVPNLQNIIATPQPQFFNPSATFQRLTALQNIAPIELYIPEPADYWTQQKRLSGQTIPLTLPIPSDVTQSGRTARFETVGEGADYELLVDTSLYGSASQFKSVKSGYLQDFQECLDPLFPKVMAILGKPLFKFNTKDKINIAFTEFRSGSGSQHAGLFSQRDRFSRNGDKTLSDGNRGEFIYIDPTLNASFACNTVNHETHHMMSFDHKSLAPLPNSRRDDLAVMNDLRTPVQRLSLSEGGAHLMELLTGELTYVPQFLRDFLLWPTETTASLEVVFEDFFQNKKTRAFATLLYLYALRRAGGTLSLDDTITKNAIATWTHSRELGIDIFSTFFHESPEDFLRQFFERLTKSLLAGSVESQFLPPREKNQNGERGFEILPLTAPLPVGAQKATSIHPLEIEMPFLSISQNHYAYPQALLAFRFRSAMAAEDSLKIRVESEDNPLFISIVLGEAAK